MALGLLENKFISIDSLLKFAFGIASESIPELLASKDRPKLPQAEKSKRDRLKIDCFILPESPGRTGAKPQGKISAKTNSHVLVEFGLKLCHFMLKRDRLKDEEYEPFIDPFVGIFKNCLKSQHVKVRDSKYFSFDCQLNMDYLQLSTLALQCLSWVMKYDLPTMKDNVKEITDAIFKILHQYAAAGLSKGDNFDLVVAAFKVSDS